MNTKVVSAALAAIVIVAVSLFIGYKWKQGECDDAFARATERHASEISEARLEAENWAGSIASRQGEAMLRAFVAGINPSILGDRRDSLGISAASVLRIPGVAGIHIFRADGGVIYSSDAKLTTLGAAGERGAWALQAPELVSRTSDRPGMLEFALPVVDSGKVLAICWMEYDLARVRDAGRKTVPTEEVPPSGSAEPK